MNIYFNYKIKMQLSKKGYSFCKEGNEDLVEYFKKFLTVKPRVNPENPNSENVSEFSLYKENSKKMYIPKALGLKMYGIPETNTLDDGIICERLTFLGELRENQKESVQLFLEAADNPKKQGGIISLSCAAGKTVIALYIACQLKRKTLIVCHKSFLLDQWKERISQFIPTAKVGLIKAQIIDVKDKDIVIGSLQSIAMKDYDRDVFKDFHIAIFDECFPYKQKIATDKGPIEIGVLYKKWKNKEDLPKVLSYNEKTKEIEYKNISHAWEKQNENLLKISYSKSNIKCTINHKILTIDGYKEANKLIIGDLLLCNVGTVKITGIESVKTNSYSYNNHVYDIEVEDNHNFICSSSSNIGPIVHNCHHLSAEVFSKALNKCTCKVMLGLSATLNRSDGLRKVFEWYIGEPVIETKKRTDTDMIIKMINYYDTDVKYGREIFMWNKKRNIAGMITTLCEFHVRTSVMINELKEVLNKEPDRKTIIISDRINHLKLIEKEIMIQLPGKTIGYYIGGMISSDLKNSENAEIMLGTYKMISEGFDVPQLNTLVLASPISAVEQSIGRVQRQKQCDRKYTPYVIDMWDNYSLFKNQGFTRHKFYKKNGYKIIIKYIGTQVMELNDNNKKIDKKVKIIEDPDE